MATPKHILDRVRAVRKRLGESGDALLVTNDKDVRYLTGFVGHDSWVYVPLGRGRVYILSDFRYTEQIQRDAPHAVALIRRKSLAEELAKLKAKLKPKRVLLQRDYVTLRQRRQLVKRLGAKLFKEADDGLMTQRAVKDESEVRRIRKAIQIQQRAWSDLMPSVKPGVSEIDLCADLEYRMRVLGAEGPSFDTIVAADANSSLPHAIPSHKKLGRNSVVQFDWGARFAGYCGDTSRVVMLGKPPRKLREIYEVVLEAQLAAIEALKPGVAYRDVDAVARRIIKDAGYEKNFGHGLGHGVGLDIHELPVAAGRSDTIAEPGHVVTIEPGIYLPGEGGVRIEDDVLVTARGRRVLSDLPKTLDSMMI